MEQISDNIYVEAIVRKTFVDELLESLTTFRQQLLETCDRKTASNDLRMVLDDFQEDLALTKSNVGHKVYMYVYFGLLEQRLL